MLRIGLTGGIGSGKTTVANRFQALGVPVIDADLIARDLVAPGRPAFQKIIQEFGSGFKLANGELNRAKLREYIFSDSNARVTLEAILHPRVREEIQNKISELNAPYCIIAIPLLIETGQMDMVDRVLVVDTPRAKQIERTCLRDGVSTQSVEAIIATQVENQTRRMVADDILENNGDIAQLLERVDDMHQTYLKLTGAEKAVENTAHNDNNPPDPHNETDTVVFMYRPQPNNESRLTVSSELTAAAEIVYELPLNEKLRTLIRLESLFEEEEFHLKGHTDWDTRAAVNTFVAILNVFSRPEIKTDLMKEMDRINTTLSKFNAINGVHTQRLKEVQDALTDTTKKLRAMEGQIGQGLKQNEFIMSIRQRDSIPGGALGMDVPWYAHWLGQSIEARNKDIRSWLAEFSLVKKAVYLILHLIRDSAIAKEVVAKAGFYQTNLDGGAANQLVRVILPKQANYFPEISGGKHRFTVRFLKGSGFERPVQIEQDVAFKLICCAL